MDKYIVVTTLCNSEGMANKIVNANNNFLKWIDNNTK